MNRYLPFLSLLLPFSLLVWRPEWTSVVALGLWTALAAVYLCALLVGDGRAAERAIALDDAMRAARDLHSAELIHLKDKINRLETRAETLTEYADGLSARLAKAERNIELCMPATPRARKDPPL